MADYGSSLRPQRDRFGEAVPESFGNWNSNFRRFRRWAVKGVIDLLFEQLSGDRDFEYAMIDGTIVRVHQQRTGAPWGPGRSVILRVGLA